MKAAQNSFTHKTKLYLVQKMQNKDTDLLKIGFSNHGNKLKVTHVFKGIKSKLKYPQNKSDHNYHFQRNS